MYKWTSDDEINLREFSINKQKSSGINYEKLKENDEDIREF